MYHSENGADARLVIELHHLLWNESFQRARSWFLKDFVPKKFGDYASFRLEHPRGSEGDMYLGQIIDWFELGYTLIDHGLLSEDLYFETTPPVRIFWQPLKPVLEAARTQLNDQGIAKPFELLNERFIKWVESRSRETQSSSG